MAEMTTLAAAIYRNYSTKVKKGTEDISPGVTSRFEVFRDETKPFMKVSKRSTPLAATRTTPGTRVLDIFWPTKGAAALALCL